MSQSHRRKVQKKLTEAIDAATDPMVIAELANALAKFLPKPKQPRRRHGTPTPNNPGEEVSLDKLVTAVEKKRQGKELSEDEKQMVAAVENKRKEEAQNYNPLHPEQLNNPITINMCDGSLFLVMVTDERCAEFTGLVTIRKRWGCE